MKKIDLNRHIKTYDDALEFVKDLFSGVLDKGGNPYIEHLIAVSNGVDSEEEKICGLLHDVLEDTYITEHDLEEIGIQRNIIDAIKLVSRNPDETYNAFIDRIIKSKNTMALKVKLADLNHNSDISRITNSTEKDYRRVEKRYKPAKEKIIKKLKELEVI